VGLCQEVSVLLQRAVLELVLLPEVWRQKRIGVCKLGSAEQDLQVREVWVSSEDTGAYGRDIGTGAPPLLLLPALAHQEKVTKYLMTIVSITVSQKGWEGLSQWCSCAI
jgi:hypothetical protein